jgi:hypothetical protein
MASPRHLWRCLCLLGLLAVGPTVAAPGAKEGGIAVIVASGSGQTIMGQEEVALIFKRKKRLTGDGQQIQPVNLPAGHPLRRALSLRLYGHAPEELEDYWRDMYFHGVLPPFVVASEEAVIRFVASTPGAVGYVSGCLVDNRVTVVMRLEAATECPH